jgi:hypothetical protein
VTQVTAANQIQNIIGTILPSSSAAFGWVAFLWVSSLLLPSASSQWSPREIPWFLKFNNNTVLVCRPAEEPSLIRVAQETAWQSLTKCWKWPFLQIRISRQYSLQSISR